MVAVSVVRVKAPDAGAVSSALEVDRSERVNISGDAAASVDAVIAACLPEGMGPSELELQNFEAAVKRADAAKVATEKARKENENDPDVMAARQLRGK